MTIIEVDGVNTEPLIVDEIQIFAGQRYSFILEADAAIDNYWIRSNPNLGTIGFDGGLNSAILRYNGANATADPTTNQTSSIIPLVEHNLVPLVNATAPGTAEIGGADVLLNLNLGFDLVTFDFTVNGVTFKPPSVPVLLQILSGNLAATDLLPNGSVYTLPPNKVVELSMPAGVAGGPVSICTLHYTWIMRLMDHSFSTHSICMEYVGEHGHVVFFVLTSHCSTNLVL